LLGSLGMGAAAIYLTDPEKGQKRRSALMKNAERLLESAKHQGEKTLKDTQHHVTGMAARFWSTMKAEQVSDRVIEERIRARMGRIVLRPRKIHVVCDQGVATLWGQAQKNEIYALVHAVKLVPGVKEVQDHLDVCEPEANPANDSDRLHQARKETRLNWSPSKRLLVGATGAALAAYGVTRKDTIGRASAMLGAGLIARSMMKNHLTSTMALSETSPGYEIEKTIRINAPVSDIYDFWVNPENYAQAFSHIARVERLGENLFRWTMNGPAGIPVGWEGVITRTIPNTLVEWKSLPGSAIGNFGVVRFDPLYDASTRVKIRMFYRPPGGILGHFLAELFGSDPSNILDQDLKKLRRLFEAGKISIQNGQPEDDVESLKLAMT
jgi:uncharacterized membrane protein